MKYLLLGIAVTCGCQTTKADLKSQCVRVDTPSGQYQVCPMPGNALCFEKGKAISCTQILGPRI